MQKTEYTAKKLPSETGNWWIQYCGKKINGTLFIYRKNTIAQLGRLSF